MLELVSDDSESETMAKTPKEHLASNKSPKYVVLDKDFAGIKRGQKMFVATPKIVDDSVREIPFGETRTIERFRRELARRAKCDASCPVSTAIFIRISAEAAIEEINAGAAMSDVTPFWRLLTSKDKIAKKLSIDGAELDRLREDELA